MQSFLQQPEEVIVRGEVTIQVDVGEVWKASEEPFIRNPTSELTRLTVEASDGGGNGVEINNDHATVEQVQQHSVCW